jgi:hypothetical protein
VRYIDQPRRALGYSLYCWLQRGLSRRSRVPAAPQPGSHILLHAIAIVWRGSFLLQYSVVPGLRAG